MRKLEELNDKEIDVLLTTVFDRYGYDFHEYAKASQKRHLENFLKHKNFSSFEMILESLSTDKTVLLDLVNGLTTSTTELFRDPDFFRSFKTNIAPQLEPYPNFKIWHAGCSTGEEVFSMAILLHEAGILNQALLYGTDINAYAIAKSKKGIIPNHIIRRDTPNYYSAGGKETLHQYWTVADDYASLNPYLLKKIVFGEHNLTTDCDFGEMNVICCRNVLIYFERELQKKVINLFSTSLAKKGFLCLGSSECLAPIFLERDFEVVDRSARIYKKR
jgi:chemotaxis protein methyltransferase CheR